jgi:O-antigen/teichoic acid export membrane protein
MNQRTRLVRGLVGGVAHEAMAVVLGLGAMLVLVRLIPPAEYGRAAAALGILAFISAFRSGNVVEHGLQLGKEEEPDWSTYFALGAVAQGTLFVVAWLVSFACTAVESLAPVAPLIQIASAGLLLDWPAQLAAVKLRREMRLERLKVIATISVACNLGVSVVLAWYGFGAAALVLGGNVVAAVPLAVDLLLVQRWRPSAEWWRPGDVSRLRPSLSFGARQLTVSLMHGGRALAESLVLSATVGLGAFGLWNRAQALFQSTFGRLTGVFAESAYPLLPLERNDAVRYAHRATRYFQAVLVLTVPGAVFVGLEGPRLSRLLYGPTWVAADPLLWPATLAVACAAITAAASRVLMGAGLLRQMTAVQLLATSVGTAALVVAFASGDATSYAWAVAAAHACGAAAATWRARGLLDAGWLSTGPWPAVAVAGGGAAALHGYALIGRLDGFPGLLLSVVIYALVGASVLSLTARPLLAELRLWPSALRSRGAPADVPS